MLLEGARDRSGVRTANQPGQQRRPSTVQPPTKLELIVSPGTVKILR